LDNTITFNDIIKKKFLEQFALGTQDLTLSRVLITLSVAFVIGLFIYYIYKRTFNGVLYSRNFNVSLVMISMVTSLIILPITSNLTLSLGMVGALSIVRFRTAVKEPIDTVFMFWAIAVGITTGAGFFYVAISGSLLIGIILLFLSLIKVKGTTPYLLVIHHDHHSIQEVARVLRQLPKHKLKSKTVTRDGIELTIEIQLKDDTTSYINRFLQISGVQDAALVSYQGDYVS
jgi:ABC-type Fe3+ transport system permease subunit